MKRDIIICSLLLVGATVANSLHATARDFEYQGITYTVLDEVSKTVETKQGTDVKSGNSAVGNLEIPETVSDGQNNFTVTQIGNYGFYLCDKLTSITLPQSIVTINDNAFSYCTNLQNVNLPEELINLNAYCFFNCSKLNRVVIPDKVESIEQGAFEKCINLEQVVLGKSVTHLKFAAFSGCTKLSNIEFNDNLKFIGAFAFQGVPDDDIVLPETVVVIEHDAFRDCKNIESIVIPENVSSIEDNVFSGCTNLKKIAYPSTLDITFPDIPAQIKYPYGETHSNGYWVASIDNSIMYYVSTKYSGYLYLACSTPNIAEYSFAYCDNIQLFILLPEVKNVANNAFEGCNFVKFAYPSDITPIVQSDYIVTYPRDNVSHDNWWMWSKDYSKIYLAPIYTSETITIPEQITEIGENAFAGCRDLTTLTCLKNLKVIGKNAFRNNPKLSSVNFLSSSDIQIGDGSFSGCNNLKNVTSNMEEPSPFADNVFDVYDTCTLNVPSHTRTTYLETEGWKNFKNILETGELVTDIVLNVTDATLNTGQTVQLTADVSPELADNKTLQWTSSDEAVATVNEDGLVTAISQGSAIITVKSTDGSDVSANCIITVRPSISDITLSETEIVMKVGEYRILTAEVAPDDAIQTELVWTSSDQSVATVQNGLILAYGQGTTIIRAEATDNSGAYAECVVHVTGDTGIANITDGVISVTTEPFIATIEGVSEDTIIRLFDMYGKLLYSGNGPRIEVAQSGLYILVVNNKSFKIKL